MICYTLPADSAIIKIMVDVMPEGTKVYFEPPPTCAIAPMPPVDYAMNIEPWEVAA
jgi:hypothetical protein